MVLFVTSPDLVQTYRGAYIKNEPEAIPGVWGSLLELFDQGKVKGVAFEKIFEFVALLLLARESPI